MPKEPLSFWKFNQCMLKAAFWAAFLFDYMRSAPRLAVTAPRGMVSAPQTGVTAPRGPITAPRRGIRSSFMRRFPS